VRWFPESLLDEDFGAGGACSVYTFRRRNDQSWNR
jgi:hypothetical protein